MAKQFGRHHVEPREGKGSASQLEKGKAFSGSAEDANVEPMFMAPDRAIVFKDIIWLLSQSPEHRYMFLADLEWAIIPPFLLEQFRVFYKSKMPVACVCWAKVDDDMLKVINGIGARIRPHEWNNGEHIVIMGVVAPFGEAIQVLDEVQKKIFPGQTVHMMRTL